MGPYGTIDLLPRILELPEAIVLSSKSLTVVLHAMLTFFEIVL